MFSGLMQIPICTGMQCTSSGTIIQRPFVLLTCKTTLRDHAHGRFCHVLDARKSGLTVRPRVKRIDETKYGGQVAWRAWKKNDEKKNTIVEKVEVVRNSRKLGPFIVSEHPTYRLTI